MRITCSGRIVGGAVALLMVVTGAAFGQGLPVASPESVGLSAERLERIGAAVERQIEEKRLAGAVTLVA